MDDRFQSTSKKPEALAAVEHDVFVDVAFVWPATVWEQNVYRVFSSGSEDLSVLKAKRAYVAYLSSTYFCETTFSLLHGYWKKKTLHIELVRVARRLYALIDYVAKHRHVVRINIRVYK